MYSKLENQKEIIEEAIKKAGTYRKLAKLTSIPKSSLVNYAQGKPIFQYRIDILSKFLEKDLTIIETLPDNWKQIKGGNKLIAIKKEKGTFDNEMKHWQEVQAEKLKKWHNHMKKNEPEKYYMLQYERFKKIAGYKFKTKRGENVRNSWEKRVADLLFSLEIDYKYEPLIHSGSHYFFPDFLINDKIIIECTMWKGDNNAYRLKEKIAHLKNKYTIFVVVPKALNIYYKILNKRLILGLDELVPIAQTFKKVEGSNR